MFVWGCAAVNPSVADRVGAKASPVKTWIHCFDYMIKKIKTKVSKTRMLSSFCPMKG